ncbi:MAG: hypothetical protein AAFY81_12120, partial [Pseudomonadota bacterium]
MPSASPFHANAFLIRTAAAGLTILACIGAALILYTLRASELRGDEDACEQPRKAPEHGRNNAPAYDIV